MPRAGLVLLLAIGCAPFVEPPLEEDGLRAIDARAMDREDLLDRFGGELPLPEGELALMRDGVADWTGRSIEMREPPADECFVRSWGPRAVWRCERESALTSELGAPPREVVGGLLSDDGIHAVAVDAPSRVVVYDDRSGERREIAVAPRICSAVGARGSHLYVTTLAESPDEVWEPSRPELGERVILLDPIVVCDPQYVAVVDLVSGITHELEIHDPIPDEYYIAEERAIEMRGDAIARALRLERVDEVAPADRPDLDFLIVASEREGVELRALPSGAQDARFVDPDHGLAVGDGLLWGTRDGGRQWIAIGTAGLGPVLCVGPICWQGDATIRFESPAQ